MPPQYCLCAGHGKMFDKRCSGLAPGGAARVRTNPKEFQKDLENLEQANVRPVVIYGLLVFLDVLTGYKPDYSVQNVGRPIVSPFQKPTDRDELELGPLRNADPVRVDRHQRPLVSRITKRR